MVPLVTLSDVTDIMAVTAFSMAVTALTSKLLFLNSSLQRCICQYLVIVNFCHVCNITTMSNKGFKSESEVTARPNSAEMPLICLLWRMSGKP